MERIRVQRGDPKVEFDEYGNKVYEKPTLKSAKKSARKDREHHIAPLNE